MTTDPYRYFRIEARELVQGLSEGVLALEKGNAGDDARQRLLRFAHTLKGAARVVRQREIAELAHAVEDELAGVRAGTTDPRSRAGVDAVLALLDAISVKIAALDLPTTGTAAPQAAAAVDAPVSARPQPADHVETVRVDIEEMDALLERSSEALAHVAAIKEALLAAEGLRRTAAALVGFLEVSDGLRGTGARAHLLATQLHAGLQRLERGVVEDVERVEREIAGVRDMADRLRLVPASSAFGALERAARDAAGSIGASVQFEAVGGNIRLDAHVLAAARDALLHVVRNAVAHGGEPQAERRAAGKPPALRVALTVERRGSKIAFICADDGRGIDVEAVRAAAVSRRLIGSSAAAAMSSDEITRLVLTAGLTTTGAVTQMSGRGVGLDVLRDTAARLDGEVNIRSTPGRGATIELCVPVSRSSLHALIVDAGGVTAAIPLAAVRRALSITTAETARAVAGEVIVHEGSPVPFVPLERVLAAAGGPMLERERGKKSGASLAVLVEVDGARAALGVDRLIGATTLVMRPLPAVVDVEPVVMGSALDVRGDPQLVLDPLALVRAAETVRAPDAASAEGLRHRVLVVDDSLTTRMLEQSILESAGYDVDVATSAEAALEAARVKRYAVFIVDVEMPGMDGFEFVTRTRADPILRETPAILVTSRNAAEDRRRGERAGARAYIVKSEFDQAHLLRTVRELIGQP